MLNGKMSDFPYNNNHYSYIGVKIRPTNDRSKKKSRWFGAWFFISHRGGTGCCPDNTLFIHIVTKTQKTTPIPSIESFFRGRRSVCTMALGDATNAAPRSAPASAMKLASLRERYVCSSSLLCVRKETDGEDAHARSRRPDSPTTDG